MWGVKSIIFFWNVYEKNKITVLLIPDYKPHSLHVLNIVEMMLVFIINNISFKTH